MKPSSLIFMVVAPLLAVSIFLCSSDISSKNPSWTSKDYVFRRRTTSMFLSQSLSQHTNVTGSVSIPRPVQGEKKDSPSLSASAKELSKLVIIEAGLARARVSIKEAVKNHSSSPDDGLDSVPRSNVYRNADLFHRSYLEMEKTFKIFVYKEGDLPIFHNGPCKNIYSIEGRFIDQMEVETKFRTFDPDKAHVYFLSFSVTKMVQYLYELGSWDYGAIKTTVVDYLGVIAEKYPYWNRSLGADHFMLSCHDWGPRTSFYVPNLYNNSIRVLCNANTSEGFDPSRDVSLPEINLKTGETIGLVGGLSPSNRNVLAFFSGRLHGGIRSVLLDHWKNKDEDVQVYEKTPKGVSYNDMMSKSKYCLCPSGYEVASPRIVEAIYAECVPVLISENYVPPFSDVLNWDSFSVQISVSDIPNIKRILTEIPQDRYITLQKNVKQVQQHFIVNSPPERYDVFHMILHSIWLRRLNIRIRDPILE
ncbi:hypothetical protein GIB67_030249 [Kingdonia uniflora]|uniref:Exostosin GT47 domain-containing protein n=1 Tax=Kingdonia uniflora TaxID=39325 RepID=A0A7J7MMY3_9MAGN|nr:hypothetical protein GIB67_030249 [Kingdonia uniflora]